jgi:DNA invertase Pin-like site-specific DNA recombinase
VPSIGARRPWDDQHVLHPWDSLSLLDLGGDCSGNGISELMLTVLAAVAQFERTRISERFTDAKAELRRTGRHQGGTQPFGYRFGPPNGEGKAVALIPDPKEQGAIRDMVRLRDQGHPLTAIQRMTAQRGFKMSHQTVDNLVKRGRLAEAAA